jgi:predicted small secreted protein
MSYLRSHLRSVCLVLPLLLLAGCNIFAGVGAVAAKAVPKRDAAAYKGLAGQTVAVMVWSERGVRIDNPYLQLDLAAGLQKKLQDIQANDKPDELKDTKFPFRADSIVRDQEDHPEIEAMPVTQIASRYNASRLIYIEVTDFSTRSLASPELFIGNIEGNVKVIEVDPSGRGKEAFVKNDIRASFPKDSPKEGLPVGTDYKIYQGTLDAFTTEVSHLLYTYEEDQ